jgi:FeS assembly SUF system protein
MESGSGRVPLDLEKPVSTHVDPPSAVPAVETPSPAVEGADLEEKVVAVLRTCYDPEIPVNIYELGLIYDIQVDDQSAVEVRMTLTSPACPVAGSLPPEVQAKIKNIPGVSDAKVEIVWDPPWTQDRMSDAAKLHLGLY